MQETKSHQTGVWLDFSRCDYLEMCRLQQELHRRRQQDTIPDVVLLLEHFPCITIGSGGGYQNLLATTALLRDYGISVHESSRGGNITYHGPGQLVCYPILSLRDDQRDLHAYARKMEEIMIRTLQRFGITAGRKSQYPGVWVGNAKIGAMGIAVRKWTTMHGISLNVCPDLRHFSCIVPCGITAHGVTSMAKILNSSIDINEVRLEMRRQFCKIFQMTMRSGHIEQLIKEDSRETA